MTTELHLGRGTRIHTAAGETVGEVERVVIDPRDHTVSHVVVSGGIFSQSRVIPVEHLETTSEGTRLLERVEDPSSYPPFKETDTVPLREGDDTGRIAWYHPYMGPGPLSPLPPAPTERVESRNVPTDEVSVEVGAHVVTVDGDDVGVIDELIVEPDTERVSSFVVREGWLFTHRTMVPAWWVASWEEDRLRLVVKRETLEQLPPHDTDRLRR